MKTLIIIFFFIFMLMIFVGMFLLNKFLGKICLNRNLEVQTELFKYLKEEKK